LSGRFTIRNENPSHSDQLIGDTAPAARSICLTGLAAFIHQLARERLASVA